MARFYFPNLEMNYPLENFMKKIRSCRQGCDGYLAFVIFLFTQGIHLKK